MKETTARRRKGTSIYKFMVLSQWKPFCISSNLGAFIPCEDPNKIILSIHFAVRIKKWKRAAVRFPGCACCCLW